MSGQGGNSLRLAGEQHRTECEDPLKLGGSCCGIFDLATCTPVGTP